jgi:hypothetical protein
MTKEILSKNKLKLASNIFGAAKNHYGSKVRYRNRCICLFLHMYFGVFCICNVNGDYIYVYIKEDTIINNGIHPIYALILSFLFLSCILFFMDHLM